MRRVVCQKKKKKANNAEKSGAHFFRNMGITNFTTASGGKFVRQETVNTAQDTVKSIDNTLHTLSTKRANPFDRTAQAVENLEAEIEIDSLINNFEMR